MKAWLEETTFNIDNSKAIMSRIGFGWGGKKKNILIIPQRGKQKAPFFHQGPDRRANLFSYSPVSLAPPSQIASWQSKDATVDPLAS